MSKRIFTTEQIEKLLSNPNVRRCSERSVTYYQDFKIRALRQYYDKGIPCSEIFLQAGLDPAVIGREQPRHLLKAWRKIHRIKGDAGLVETRGRSGRPRTKGVTEMDRIKRLEAENAYLKAENAFLAKLRRAAGIH